jgi:hypothetical protein
MLTAGLLAGCTSPAPTPTEPPTAAAPAPEPTPSPSAETAPDLIALCEQLLPLETVQERFGDDVELLTGRSGVRPDISTWAGLLRGRIDCEWGTTNDRNVAVTLTRGDTSFFSATYRSVESAPATATGGDWRYDAIGTSVDACETLYASCQYSLLVGESDDWLEIDLRADAGSSLLPADEIRTRWDPEVQRISEVADEVLGSLPEPVEPSPACESLLSDAEASEILGFEVRATEPGLFFHDMSLLGAGGPTLKDSDHCLWADYDGGLSVAMTWDPADLRAAAFDDVTGEIDGVGSGERVEVAGADDAWSTCFEREAWTDCSVDLRVGELWLAVQVDGADAGGIVQAAARIVANLAS